jgi:hypothetical protein
MLAIPAKYVGAAVSKDMVIKEFGVAIGKMWGAAAVDERTRAALAALQEVQSAAYSSVGETSPAAQLRLYRWFEQGANCFCAVFR